MRVAGLSPAGGVRVAGDTYHVPGFHVAYRHDPSGLRIFDFGTARDHRRRLWHMRRFRTFVAVQS